MASPSSEPTSSQSRFRRYQVLVYLITFTAYALSHFSRKSYTFFKQNMRDEDHIPLWFLGRLDSAFMASYAIGSFASGSLGDHYFPPLIIAGGLVGSGLCLTSFVAVLYGGLGTDGVVTTDDTMPLLLQFILMTIWTVHGLTQSTGGPVNTVVVGRWFPKNHRGFLFGTWTCHQYVGNIIGALVSSFLLSRHVSYHIALLVPAAANVVWAVVVQTQLPSTPEEVDCKLDEEETPMLKKNKDKETEEKEDVEAHAALTSHPQAHTQVAPPPPPPAISILAAFSIPNVSMYAIAFGFFKLTNYTLFFWLPFFLSKFFTQEQANTISILYDLGMMPGGIIVGWISDRMGGRRATVCSVLLIALCPILAIFGLYADELPVLALLLLMLLMGILVGGPNNIISSAVAADLALDPLVSSDNRALGTVTGLINGTGSITAALGLLAVTHLQQQYGWNTVWYFLIACTLTGVLVLAPKIKSELTS